MDLLRNAIIILILLMIFSCDRSNDSARQTNESQQNQLSKTTEPDVISWHDVKNHIGEYVTVRGTVVNTQWAKNEKGKPTFLNIGRPYPVQDRFVVKIMGRYRKSFPTPPETMYYGKTIAVTGIINISNGVPQIEVSKPGDIEIS